MQNITQNKINSENISQSQIQPQIGQPQNAVTQNATQILNVSHRIFEGILQVQNAANNNMVDPYNSSSFQNERNFNRFENFSNYRNSWNTGNETLQAIALPVKASDIIQSVAQQNLPLRIEVTLHLNDLIPISVISGLCIILLAILPVLIYRMRQNL